MALWKITCKTTGTINGIRLEKGMSVEIATKGAHPMQDAAYHSQIVAAFENKYAMDLDIQLVNSGRFNCEKIQ